MNDNIFFLFLQVIDAAKGGRYMFGNGAQWYILTDYGRKVVIDTINGTTTECASYEGTPRTDLNTVSSIENFLMTADSVQAYTCEYRYSDAKDIVREAVAKNELLFTNGNQWFVKSGTHSVVMVPLGVMTSHVTVRALNCHASWKYMRNNPRPCILTESTRQYMGF